MGLDWKNWVSKVDRDVRHCCKRNATQPCGQLSDRRSCNAGQFATICGNRHSCRQNISTTYRLIYLSLYILTIFHSTQGTNPMDTLKQRWQVLPAGQTVHKSAFALAKTIIAEEGNVNSCRTFKAFCFCFVFGVKKYNHHLYLRLLAIVTTHMTLQIPMQRYRPYPRVMEAGALYKYCSMLFWCWSTSWVC